MLNIFFQFHNFKFLNPLLQGNYRDKILLFNNFLLYKTYFGRLIAMYYLEYGLKTRVGLPPVRKLPLLGVIFCFIFQKS